LIIQIIDENLFYSGLISLNRDYPYTFFAAVPDSIAPLPSGKIKKSSFFKKKGNVPIRHLIFLTTTFKKNYVTKTGMKKKDDNLAL